MRAITAAEDAVPEIADAEKAAWEAILSWRAAARAGASPPLPALRGSMAELYLPLLHHFGLHRSLVIAHLGQSLDGRIATPSGASQWITGEEDLLHTHRLRALADAVIVGAGTVAADDPRLTVRRCAGASPVRVVIDADGKLSADCRVFASEGQALHES